MDRKVLLALAFTAVFVAGALLVLVAQSNPDPLAAFRTPDGKLTIPGGKMTKELQALLFPPAPPKSYFTYQPARSTYPTLLIEGVEHSTSEFAGSAVKAEGPAGFVRPIAWLVGQLKPLLTDALGFFTGSANAAVCGDGLGPNTCTWSGAIDTNWNTVGNWGVGLGPPQTGDTVVFNGTGNTAVTVNVATPTLNSLSINSGFTSTITVSVDQTNTWGTVAFGAGTTGTLSTNGKNVTFGTFTLVSGGTLTAGASTITLNGNWDSSAGTFTFGTSTVVLAASGSLITSTSSGGTTIYNVTINTSVTTTVSTGIGIGGTLTVNGSLSWAGINSVYLNNTAATTTPLVFGGSGSFTGNTSGNIHFASAVAVTIPSHTDYPVLNFSPTANGATYTLGGAITVGQIFFRLDSVTNWSPGFQTSNFSITATSGIRVHDAGGFAEAGTGNLLQFGSSTVIVSSVIFDFQGKASPKFQTSTWTVTGAWINYDLSTSLAWDAGTSSVTLTFPSGVASSTVEFGGQSKAEFYNLTVSSAFGSAATLTMATNSLRLANLLTISDTVSTTNLNTSAVSNFTITAGAVTIGSGGILTANASTITVSGNWDSSAGTFTFGTSTVVTAATSTVKVASGGRGISRFYNWTINSSIVATVLANSMGVANVLTLNGAVAGFQPIFISSASANPLVIGGSGTFNTTGQGLVLYMSVSYNIPAIAGGPAIRPESSSTGNLTATFQGNLTVPEFYINAGGLGMLVVDTNGFNLTSTSTNGNTFIIGPSSGTTIGGGLLLRNGTHQVRGNVFVQNTISYIDFGSSTLSSREGWNNNSTSASWSAGTSTVLFNTQGFVFQMNLGNATNYVGGVEFNNVTFVQASGTGFTYTMAANALKAGGALTIQRSAGSGTVTLTTSGSNLAITAGAVTIGSGGALTANASTITDSGNWDSSAGTFTKGTSTVTMSGATKTVAINGTAGFYNLTVSGTVSQTNALAVSQTLATSGSGTLTTGGFNITGGSVLSLVGTGGLTATTSAVTFGNVTVGSGTTFSFTSGTATASGNWDSSVGTFTAGTSLVTLSGATKTVKTSFYDLTVSGTYTALANLTVTHILTVSGTGSLDLGVFTATFVSLTVGASASLLVSGANGSQTVSNFAFSTDSGTIALIGTDWTAYDTVTPQIEWKFNPSAAGATVTMTFGSLSAPDSQSLSLSRDGTVIASTHPSGGSVTFVITAGWSLHDMLITPTPGGGGGGGNPPPTQAGTLSCQPLGGLTYQCTVTPASGQTVATIAWNWGDGKTTTTTTNSAIHTYAAPGTYSVVANVSYTSGKTETLTSQLVAAAGPSILDYLLVIVFLISAIGTAVSRRHAKMFWAAMALVLGAWMLYLLPVTAFPVFFPRVLLQGIVLLGGIAAMAYGLFPDDKAEGERGPSHRHRIFWLAWGALMVILFFVTR